MTLDEHNRVATLTTGAISTTADNAIKAMLDAVEAAEAKTAEMRAAVEYHIKEFKKVTEDLASNVTTHVAACQTVIDSFQAHHLKILNIDPPQPDALEQLREVGALPPRDLDEFNQLREVGKTLLANGRR